MNPGKIVDLAGNPLSLEKSGQIVDASGRVVASANGNGKKPRIGIKGLVVTALCSDGNFRQVTLDDRQARKLTRFLLRLQNGALQLQSKPVFVFLRNDEPAIKKPAHKDEENKNGG